MYGWGGKDPKSWKGKASYDFGSARARYDKAAKDAGISKRTYSRNREPDMSLVDPRGKVLSSDSTDPVIIAVDVTGSMSSWPGEIFDRLPLLYQTLAKYRPNLELSFAAIGDATCDNYPLQVSDFSSDIKQLEANLKALGCEGGGGGHITESYELFGHFMDTHCKTPNATSPFLLVYGDETPYPKIDSRQVKHFIGDKIDSDLESKAMWESLMQKFNLYFLHKAYGSSGERSTTDEVRHRWGSAIGLQRVIELPFEIDGEDGRMPGYQRAVDIGMGLIAKYWGEYRDFGKSLDARHDDPAVKSAVHRSLRHIDADPSAKSLLKLPAPSKRTKSLAD